MSNMIKRAFFLFLSIFTSNAYFLNEEECLNYTVYPVQYELRIIPHIYNDQRFYYDCDLIITVIANNPNVNVIQLDGKGFEIKSSSLGVYDGDKNIIDRNRPYEYDKAGGKLYIYLNEYLKEYKVYKKQYSIRISFSKYLNYDTTGVFVVKYFDNGKPKYMFTTRLSPDKAKYFFPCFDNPHFDAVFKFKVYTVTPPRDSKQYSNTSLVIAQELKNYSPQENYVVIDYAPSPQIALRQVGFHYSQFVSRRVTSRLTNDTLVIWAPAPTLQFYGHILDYGITIIKLMHEYSSLNRVLVNGPINIVSVPSNLNGYEIDSWNLLTNADTRLAYVPHFTSIQQLDIIHFELAQQLCRIWLGNPGEVERTKWKEEWFKEGVATYYAYYFITQFNYGAETKIRLPITILGLQMKHKAMAIDWHHSTPALATFNQTLAVEIPSRYKNLVTMKTASILWMVENWLGSEKFHQAFTKYINSRRGNYISLEDFMTNLDLNTVECLHQFFNGFTASKILNSWFHRPGYPVVYVQVLRDRARDAIQLKQSQFSFTDIKHVDSNYLIPISYLVQNNQNCFNCFQPRFTIGVQTYSFEENLNGGWIILNRNASGYYRVNYDEVTWRLIAKTLKEDHLSIDVLNRAQIVNDVFALYVGGYIDLELAVEILGYLQNEQSHIVWESVIEGFELLEVEGASCKMSKQLYAYWQKFIRERISTVYNLLVNDVKEQAETRQFRSRIVEFARSVHYPPCVSVLQQIYDEQGLLTQKLNPDLRQSYYQLILDDIKGTFHRDKINRFEQDDLSRAEHKINLKNKFQYRLPAGDLKIMEKIIMSTTSTVAPSTAAPTAEATVDSKDSSTSNMASLAAIAVTSLIVAAMR